MLHSLLVFVAVADQVSERALARERWRQQRQQDCTMSKHPVVCPSSTAEIVVGASACAARGDDEAVDSGPAGLRKHAARSAGRSSEFYGGSGRLGRGGSGRPLIRVLS